MKKVAALIIALSMCATAFSQNSRQQARAAQEIYEATDPLIAKAPKEIPDKFQNSSAVGLATVLTEKYEGNASKRVRTSYYRILVKIQDMAARDEYSTFNVKSYSFNYFGYRSQRIYAIRLIKPSGEIMDVDVMGEDQNAESEIAIPNLEIGDVLDYGIKSVETIQEFCFDSRLETLTEDFPILYGYQRIDVQRGFFVNYGAQNGAPEMVLNEELSDRRNLVYEIKYANLGQASDEVWTPDYRTEATQKLQICYYPISSASKAPYFFGSPYEVKTTATDQEKYNALYTRYQRYINYGGDNSTKFFSRWLKSNFSDRELTNEEYMNYAFYHYRYYILVLNPYDQTYRSDYLTRYIRSENFVGLMSYAARQRKIPFEVVYTTSKNISNLDQAILIGEIALLCRYKDEAGEWHYMENPTSYQTVDFMSQQYQGQEALAGRDRSNFERITLPITTADDNIYRTVFNITPELDSKIGKVTALTSTSGLFKYYMAPFALADVAFYKDVEQATLPEGQTESLGMKRSAARRKESSEDKVEVDPQKKLNKMKEMRSEDFDIADYTSFELINSGVKSNTDSLKFREKYTINDVVEKVGPNYVINISKIAPDQISFTDQEREHRENDVFINYPKTYEYLYRVRIPEGYKVHGLETFNETAETKYGSVNMRAEQEGDEVIIKLTKAYREVYIPASEWPGMMEFLGPAMKINDARLVLKKG